VSELRRESVEERARLAGKIVTMPDPSSAFDHEGESPYDERVGFGCSVLDCA
jgi:hypothetical protein